ncbi:hypothetical protein [Gluconacetobacter tumulisoli]|uniref:hypothetical protein n=1 Tax=Gluconacetobacter tumulisoli TaxID=1286189 RepID=UPI001FE75CB0|nr:hypothetical protein [Gluconacetobacter tumulisoli]
MALTPAAEHFMTDRRNLLARFGDACRDVSACVDMRAGGDPTRVFRASRRPAVKRRPAA